MQGLTPQSRSHFSKARKVSAKFALQGVICGAGCVELWYGLKPDTKYVGFGASWEEIWFRPVTSFAGLVAT